MATKYEVELWKEQCRKLTAALDRSWEEKLALTARIRDNSEEAKTAKAVADGLEWQVEELQEENAKLRELVRMMQHFEELGCCGCPHEDKCDADTLYDPYCPMREEIKQAMRELGVEVDE